MDIDNSVVIRALVPKEKYRCRICRSKLHLLKQFKAKIHSYDGKRSYLTTCPFLYCIKCKLPYLCYETEATLRVEAPGFYVEKYEDVKNKNADAVQQEIMVDEHFEAPKNENINKSVKHKPPVSYVSSQKPEQSTNQPLKELEKHLHDCSSAMLALRLQYDDGTYEDWLIVKSLEGSKGKQNVLLYNSDDALELLTGAFARERKGNAYRGTFRGRQYKVPYCKFSSEYSKVSIAPVTLYIKPQKRKQTADEKLAEKNVSVLLYSPFNKRYKWIGATLLYGELYLPISQFRDFVSKYGNPGIELEPHMDHSRDNSSRWDELREESFFKAYGYTVDAKVGMYKDKRRELLTEIIDLKLRTKNQVIEHIYNCIRLHPGEIYEVARSIWRSDIDYLMEDFDPNPSRFYIVGNIVKK